MYKRIKAALNGKKTAIGVLLAAAPVIVEQFVQVCVAFGGDPARVATWSGAVLTVVGLTHKCIKLLTDVGIFYSPDQHQG